MRIESYPIEPAFVERELTCSGKSMFLRFYRPEQNPTGEYKCQWEIHWPERIRRSKTYGVDSIQALILAMSIVHVELLNNDKYSSQEITYLEGHDLDLPVLRGDEE